MTHFFSGVAEFTLLGEWLRDRRVYNNAMKIPFFDKYRIWKGFTVWKRNIRVSKMVESRQTLVKNLFFLDPLLRESLLQLRTACLDVTSKRMILIGAGKTYELNDFIQDQQTWYEGGIKSYLLEFERTTRSKIDATCLESLSQTEMAAIANDKRDSAKSRSAKSRQSAGSRTAMRLTYTEQAAKRNACRRLQRFVKLSDYLIVNGLHSLAVNSIHDLLGCLYQGCKDSDVVVPENEKRLVSLPTTQLLNMGDASLAELKRRAMDESLNLKSEDSERKPMFRAELLLNTTELYFAPSSNEFVTLVDQMVKGFVSTAESMKLIANTIPYLDQSDSYEQSEFADGPNVGNIILDDEFLQALTIHSKGALTGMFRNAVTYSHGLDVFVRMFKENKEVDFTWIKRPIEMTSDEIDKSLEYFDAALVKYSQEKHDVETIAATANVNNLCVDMQRLKQTLLPNPQMCFEALSGILPTFARELNELLLNSLNNTVSILSSQPSSVETFVEFLSHLAKGIILIVYLN
jgi:dynein heavy chain